ncbi:unnamed protein product [Ceutorhynchus assimilis]|uniref:Uncharacterized protein n=1 Tax=Ceutorhynchus assimilis TaxID=467358 RepID=A0A9N9QSH3_9CUCU|nr:unnamed protein product [Ceutorhynchus assimilis]
METRGLNEQINGMFPDLKRLPGRVGQVTAESQGGKIALFQCKRQIRENPTLRNLYRCWQKTKSYALEQNIESICIQQKIWGLKSRTWRSMKQIITEIFRDTNIKVMIQKNEKNIQEPENIMCNITIDEQLSSLKLGMPRNQEP